ncbi:hypothetical protein [uncultured Acidaminococcus sp.]|uniref:hypothetical protein n=1 Tax=uncultured Acidaminococcus sp. TaxID=352152 RepID=UPI0026DB8623|nr:hypothetical protein [uncultured Acidaminococcus sp.]
MKNQTYPIPQYRGKKIGRLEIVDIWGGHQEVPEKMLALGRLFGHEPDAYAGNFLTALLLLGRQNYKADLRWTPDAGYEFIVFKCDLNGRVSSGRSYYEGHRYPNVTIPTFLWYINDFAKEVKK